MPVSLQVCGLHEKAGQQTLLYVVEVLWISCRSACYFKSHFLDHVQKLVAHVFGLFESPLVQIVLPAPVSIHSFHHIGVEGVKESQMVSVCVNELTLGVVSFDLLVFWSVIDVRNADE